MRTPKTLWTLSLAASIAGLSASGQTTLQDNKPVSVSGVQGSAHYFKIRVPAGQTLLVSTSGGWGACELYARFDARLATSSQFRSVSEPIFGNGEQMLTVWAPTAGDWHIMIRGATPYGSISLLAHYLPLKPGDLLLYEGNSLISDGIMFFEMLELGYGSYSHAAIYAGPSNAQFPCVPQVAEMLGDGLSVRDLQESIVGADRVDAKRHAGIGNFGPAVARQAKRLDGTPYADSQLAVLGSVAEYGLATRSQRILLRGAILYSLLPVANQFAGGKKAMICSEMCARAYYSANPSLAVSVTPWPDIKNLGIWTNGRNRGRDYDYVTPNMLALSPSFVSVGQVK